VLKRQIFQQAVQKCSWFDKACPEFAEGLTMTVRKPVLSLSKEGAQRSMQTPSPRRRGWAFFNSLMDFQNQ